MHPDCILSHNVVVQCTAIVLQSENAQFTATILCVTSGVVTKYVPTTRGALHQCAKLGRCCTRGVLHVLCTCPSRSKQLTEVHCEPSFQSAMQLICTVHCHFLHYANAQRTSTTVRDTSRFMCDRTCRKDTWYITQVPNTVTIATCP